VHFALKQKWNDKQGQMQNAEGSRKVEKADTSLEPRRKASLKCYQNFQFSWGKAVKKGGASIRQPEILIALN